MHSVNEVSPKRTCIFKNPFQKNGKTFEKQIVCITQQEKSGSNLKYFTLIKINSLVPASYFSVPKSIFAQS